MRLPGELLGQPAFKLLELERDVGRETVLPDVDSPLRPGHGADDGQLILRPAEVLAQADDLIMPPARRNAEMRVMLADAECLAGFKWVWE